MNELERQVAQYVDGEMRRDEQMAFAARIRDDGELRRAVDEVRGLRALFGPGRAEHGPVPSADFRGRVLAAALATPRRGAAHDLEPIERWSRRVLYAAAAVFALAVLTAIGLLGRPSGDGRLEASPAEVQRAMELLDAKIGAATASEAPSSR